jgi:two-component system, chemotaxis family, response regulator PixG
MTQPNVPPEIPIRDFNAAKQTKLFQTLKKPRFTGCLTLTSPLGREWNFYLYLGRLVYASGGVHPVRCWRRNLTAYMPNIAGDRLILQKDLSQVNINRSKVHWEYDLLRKWHDQGRVSREQVSDMVQGITTEIFFDVSQTTQVTYRFAQFNYGDNPLILLDADHMITRAWKLLEQWNTLEIAHLSPNTAPNIQDPDLLKERSSPSTFKLLTTLITPYIKMGFIDLVSIEDLSAPANITVAANQMAAQLAEDKPTASQPLIAYIDPDEEQRRLIGTLLKGINYQYLPIANPLKAMSILLTQKPNLIILEMNLDGVSGLDMCAQLKKLSLFRQTPILILTDSTGIFDRVKSRLMGATDFMVKPFEPEEIAMMIEKYLH